MNLESDNLIENALDRINAWGDGLRLIQWIQAIDARVGQWSVDQEWNRQAKHVQKLLKNYPPTSSARNTISTYFAAKHAQQYAPWESQTELDRVRHFRIAEKTMTGGNPVEIAALTALMEIIG